MLPRNLSTIQRRAAIRSLSVLLLVVQSAALSGCVGTTRPAVPGVLSTRSVGSYSPTDFDLDYAAYKQAMCTYNDKTTRTQTTATTCSPNLEVAKARRDAIINGVKTVVDRNYHEFETRLFLNRASTNILGDITELGVAAATTISNGERVKTILAAGLTAFKGTRLSLDQNLFAEKTTQIIISKMQASRNRLNDIIVGKRSNLNPSQYPLEEAFDDLVNYFYAGTLTSGLQELANDAGQDAAAAKNDTRHMEQGRAGITSETADRAVQNKARYDQLYKDALIPPIDMTKQAEAVRIAKLAYKDLSGKDPDPDVQPSKLFIDLHDAMVAADKQSADGVDRIHKALRIPR